MTLRRLWHRLFGHPGEHYQFVHTWPGNTMKIIACTDCSKDMRLDMERREHTRVEIMKMMNG